MATTIVLKNSVTTTNTPSSLTQGEVAVNVTDKKVWVGNAATTPILLINGGDFPSGTNMLFVQTAAPTGWTKVTTYNDYALRVVSGTASTGGSVAFTTAFASQTPAGTVGTSGATTLSTSQIPSHIHSKTTSTFGSATQQVQIGSATTTNDAFYTDATGGGGSHTHTGGTFTGTAINLAVSYVDTIIATKN